MQHGGDIYSTYEMKYSDKLIDFSVNLNPFGMPDEIKSAVKNSVEELEAYPDVECRALKKRIAEFEGISSDMILCTNGAADAIYRIAGVLKPKKALLAAPSFSEYEKALVQYGCEVNFYFTKEENSFMLDKTFISALSFDTDIVFICNPNNPTGKLEDKNIILEVLKKANEINAVVVIDECFMNFAMNEAEHTTKTYISEFKNLIILKSFTKMYSMAGIRLGYLFSSDTALINRLSAYNQPWAVSTFAQKCGIAALDIEGFIDKTKEYVKTEREYLTIGLTDIGFKVFDSDANFLLLKCSDKYLFDALIDYGLLIRRCFNFHGLDEHYYRVAVRNRSDNEYLLNALKKVTAG